MTASPGVDVRLATSADIGAIHALMVESAAAVDDPRSYVVDDRAFIGRHIADQGFTLLACVGKAIVAALIVRIPGPAADNLGLDIGLSGADLDAVAHIESVAVRPGSWGHGLQRSSLSGPRRSWAGATFAG